MKFIEAQKDMPDNIFSATHTLENFLLNCQIKNIQQKQITHDFLKK